MTEIDELKAHSILGLPPGATSSQINNAHKKLVAFFDDDEDDESEALKPLIEPLQRDIDAAYKLLLQSTAAGAGGNHKGTISGVKQQQAVEAPGRKNDSIIWMVAFLLFGVIFFQMLYKEPSKQPARIDILDPNPAPGPGPSPISVIQPPAPDKPPDFITPFIHADDEASGSKISTVRWTSGWENLDGAQRMVVWAYAANADPVYKFEMYQDGSKWREWRHYIIRYSADRLHVAVQRFQEAGAVPVFKDQRNVSSSGDVLVQTTTYNFLPSTKLDSVRVDTPFIQNKDGLKFNRDGESIDIERLPSGGSINLQADSRQLNNQYDLWSVFGAPNI